METKRNYPEKCKAYMLEVEITNPKINKNKGGIAS